MSYALNTTQSLNWIVRSATEVETNIVSIERIVEYIDLPSEAPLINQDNRPDEKWPEKGAIVFENYATRYREGLDLVLKDVSFKIQPGTKVGVCGRTGAGKSTLTLALYRVIERVSGRILIDDVSCDVWFESRCAF
jgi:ABC-type multidrug transport system fused ATPase/permease subunit